ncbi:UDP-N-acetylmuramoyl-tripeptide--D-alanyl-D-alanine ligase [Candidatus Bipolaricaulota bacterium]|nr:UDP-N-acetylmuramoyl-tripeptide--D-alanyl-D-alanine ligase [Candidatus Bipolaricaulota bacterium]
MFSPGELAKHTEGKLLNQENRAIEGFSIDTRTLSEGDFFVPVSGSETDGHYFLREAFNEGASGAFVRSEEYLDEDFANIVLVEDTEKALLDAASSYRTQFDIPIVGITGSWGKTTTKELLHSILSLTGSVHKSPGNYNTEYGLPLALLEMDETSDYGVFELGLQYPGDVGKLSEVLSPTHGVITGAGKVHLEHFQDVGEIVEEKLQLTEGMDPGSTLIVNGDVGPLTRKAAQKKGYDLIKYGVNSPKNTYLAGNLTLGELTGLSFSLIRKTGYGEKSNTNSLCRLESGLHSRANVYNVLASGSLALEMGTRLEKIRKGVKIEPIEQRLSLVCFSGGTVIDDTYNANPAATRNALEFLSELDVSGDKFFVFGDMMELGNEAPRCHKDLASYVQSAGVKRLLGLGKFTKKLVFEINTGVTGGPTGADWFNSREALKERLGTLIQGRDNAVLVKGSRDMEMEEFVSFLRDGFVNSVD